VNEIICTGLDGANPLHMLASLGLLRLADRIAPGARLGWRTAAGAWRPVLASGSDLQGVVGDIAAWIRALSCRSAPDPDLQSRNRSLSASVKRLKNKLRTAKTAAKAVAKAQDLKGTAAKAFVAGELRVLENELHENEAELSRAQKDVARAGGQGIAHWGDVIGVNADIVRHAAQTALASWSDSSVDVGPDPGDARIVIGHLPALACDRVTVADEVLPTPFSFSNGSSGQCLLKDFRSCAERCTPERLLATLTEGEGRLVPGSTGLNWDPADQRSYALHWYNPEDKKHNPRPTDPAANALGYVGLALLPAVPFGRRLTAVGWGTNAAWTWPIWEPALALPVVTSLLAYEALQSQRPDRGSLWAIGVREVRRAVRINPTGKRYFFAPSVPV